MKIRIEKNQMMYDKKRLIFPSGLMVFLLGFFLSTGLTGCGRKNNDELVIAKINSLEITLGQFQTFYRPRPNEFRTLEEQVEILKLNLDDLIGYKLIQEGGRADRLHRTDDFKRRLERHIKDLLNRLVKQREIVEAITITNAEIDSLLSRSFVERQFQHIITLNLPAALEVEDRLLAGEDWGSVAVVYSRDDEVVLHRGNLGWLAWGEGPFSVYLDLQPVAYEIPVGTWQGPIQVDNEYHFINVVEERSRQRGTPEDERAAAYSRIFSDKQEQMEQDLANRMWSDKGFHLDEDQFRWLIDEINKSFDRDAANNPIPQFSREDSRRVIVRSDSDPYTATDLLDHLELLTPRERDNQLTLVDWRHLFVNWVIMDQVAEYATSKGYRRNPGIIAAGIQFTDSRLYALKLENLRSGARPATDQELQRYYEQNPQFFDLPERRQIVEVLVATSEEAESLLRRARAGESISRMAEQYTIRPGFKERSGRFASISRQEFGALGEAIFETPLDEIGPVVETPLGFSIYLVTDVQPPHVISLEDVSDNLRENFRIEMARTLVEDFKAEAGQRSRIRKNAEILTEWAEQIVAWREAASEAANEAASSDSTVTVPPDNR